MDLVWLGEAPPVKHPGDYQPGWAFFVDPDWMLFHAYEMNPALDRRVIVACLPSNVADYRVVAFPIDSRSTEAKAFWTVTVNMASLVVGQKPDITVSPSIEIQGGYYHGFLTNGTVGPG